MEPKKLITDFVDKYRTYIMCTIAIWFVITTMLTYLILSSVEDINMIMCFGYLKAKIRAWCFFLPDNWLSGIGIKAGAVHFKRILAIWMSVFAEYGWQLYMYILCTFLASFLTCAVAVYKYFQYQIKKFKDNIVVTGKLLNQNEFQEKYPEVFGDYLTFAGLNFSEQIFKTPFYVWGNDENVRNTLGKFLEDARFYKRKVIIFEAGSDLYNTFFDENDVLLNPLVDNGISWNLLQDMQYNKGLIEEILKKITVTEKRQVIQDIIRHLADSDITTKDFFKTLCFEHFSKVQSILRQFANIQDDQDSFKKIRNKISDDLYCFKSLTVNTKEMSFNEYYRSDKSILWISCHHNVHMKSIIPMMKQVIYNNTIKITASNNDLNFDSNVIVLNGLSSGLYYESSKLMFGTQNKTLIDLFGDTITEYPTFCGIKYKKTFAKIVKNDNSAIYFQYSNIDDVMIMTNLS